MNSVTTIKTTHHVYLMVTEAINFSVEQKSSGQTTKFTLFDIFFYNNVAQLLYAWLQYGPSLVTDFVIYVPPNNSFPAEILALRSLTRRVLLPRMTLLV